MYANVVLTKNTKAIDMAFTYSVPNEYLESLFVGSKVIVPFGQGSILTEGFVIELMDTCDYKRIKKIHSIISDISLSLDGIDKINFLREMYLCSYSEAISAIVPSGTKLSRKTTYSFLKEPQNELIGKQNELLNLIKSNTNISEEEIKEKKLMLQCKELLKNKYISKKDLFFRDINVVYKKQVTSLITLETLEESLNKLSKRGLKQKKILSFICEARVCDVSLLNYKLNCTKAILDKLEKEGFIKVFEVEKFRKPDILSSENQTFKNALSIEQRNVFTEIEKSIDKNISDTFLLHGITGSGKTEVYMELAQKVVDNNKQVIILVPEISLTPQIVAKFIRRFGVNIAIIHSKLSMGERFDQYRAIQSGNVSIIIGARSAIFSPCPNLGLVIIDEEHENTYKSESNPKYNTIDVGIYLGEKNNFPVLLASATPSLNSYYKAEMGEYKLLEIKNRFSKSVLPEVFLVDMREELSSGNKSMFSELLEKKINDTIARSEQVILFYNRKGYSTFVSCRMCGYALKCPHCDIALTYHHHKKEAKCSYCDFKMRVPEKCPECTSSYFKYFGAGTEKVEEIIRNTFPTARIARMDSETTSKKGSLETIIKQMETNEVDILLGTQMVTKGLDFANVTLVGAISADMSLNLPDYKAAEKTFQLLTQVAGRAGRGDKKGEVVIQTYVPDNYVLLSSINHDYLSFYYEEKQMREIYGYPPFREIISILIVGEHENNLIRSSMNLFKEITRFINKKINPDNIEILGPNPAIFQKINKKYRWQIILKFDKMDLVMIRNILHYVCIKNKDKVVLKDIYISININPMSLL